VGNHGGWMDGWLDRWMDWNGLDWIGLGGWIHFSGIWLFAECGLEPISAI